MNQALQSMRRHVQSCGINCRLITGGGFGALRSQYLVDLFFDGGELGFPVSLTYSPAQRVQGIQRGLALSDCPSPRNFHAVASTVATPPRIIGVK